MGLEFRVRVRPEVEVRDWVMQGYASTSGFMWLPRFEGSKLC